MTWLLKRPWMTITGILIVLLTIQTFRVQSLKNDVETITGKYRTAESNISALQESKVKNDQSTYNIQMAERVTSTNSDDFNDWLRDSLSAADCAPTPASKPDAQERQELSSGNSGGNPQAGQRVREILSRIERISKTAQDVNNEKNELIDNVRE